MPNGAASRRGAFPSRRSLREAPAYPSRRSLRAAPAFPTRRSLRESLRESLPEVEPTVHLEADASEPVAPENPIAPLEAPGAGQHGGTSAFLTLPLVAIPIPSHATEVTAPPRGTRMLRKSLAATSGLVCALGLLLTGMVPALGEAEAGEPAAALPHQELAGSFGDLTTAGPASALGSVAAEPSGDPVDFVNFRDARVQFPFATGQELTDGFGPRTYPVAGMHEAQDFAAPDGTTVQAIADGRVLETGDTTDGCGFGVLLEHTIDGSSVTSRYCHMQMNSNDLEVGQSVKVGDPVGRVGATGIAFGSHLHFALTIDGVFVDPMPFLLTQNRQTRG